MKDITIKGSFIKQQLLYLLGCFVVAFAVNTYAVIHYDRPAIELLSQLGFVVVIALSLYLLIAFMWLLYCLISHPFKK